MIEEQRKIFFKKGWLKLNTFVDKNFSSLLNDLEANKIRGKFQLVSKYPGTFDIRPSAYEYSDLFLKWLLFNNIPETINQVTGKKLFLKHVQFRISHKTKNNYLNWHRDTHFYNGMPEHGNIPPVYKLIFYPRSKDTHIEKCLSISDSSNIQFSFNNKVDLIKALLLRSRHSAASTGDTIFFNTFTMHKPLRPNKNKKQMRIIYSFSEVAEPNSEFLESLQTDFIKMFYES